MRKKIKIFIIIAILFFVLVIMFIPFCFYDKNSQTQYCKYRLGVYSAFWDETDIYEEHSEDDIFFFNIILYDKIGGPLEYFGLKEIKKDSTNKLK